MQPSLEFSKVQESGKVDSKIFEGGRGELNNVNFMKVCGIQSLVPSVLLQVTLLA